MARAPASTIRRALSALLSDIGHGSGGAGTAIGGMVGAPVGAGVGMAMGADPDEIGPYAYGGMGMGAGLGGALDARMGRRALMEALRSGEERAPTNFARNSFGDDELSAAGGDAPIDGSPEAETQSGYGPRANPMTQLQELAAMRRALRQLEEERRFATDEQEARDIDLQIAVLRRQLGMGQ